MTRVIGFAGMTHLGVNSAAAVADRGFTVVGYDANGPVIDGLRQGRPPVAEPGLDDLLRRNASRISFSTDLAALRGCDVVYISSDVPTDDHGRSDLTDIDVLVADVAGVLHDTAVLVVLCQVPPGFTRKLAAPDSSRRYYQVETLIFGRAVERAMYPERYIVGCADPSQPLPAAFGELLAAFQCPILPMSYESAELAKISINFCLVASVTVANTLAELCESVGADWSEIVPSLKLDKRIGQHAYLGAGLGLSGGNLERDLATVLRLAEECGTQDHPIDVGVIRAWLDNSRHRKDWPWLILRRELLSRKPDARIALWGLAYKENTHSVKNAPSLALLRHLDPSRVTAYDPVVRAADHDLGIAQAATPIEAVRNADALVVVTPWPELRTVDVAATAAAMKGRLLLDPYRLLDGDACAAAGFKRYVLGAGGGVNQC